MSSPKFTPGPWQWEFNANLKSLALCGGRPRFDLRVMDFIRWGVSGAGVRFREDAPGLELMYSLPDRYDWIAPHPGRGHHASWCANVIHPDASLIAAAPDLYAALEAILDHCKSHDLYPPWEQIARAALAKARGEG